MSAASDGAHGTEARRVVNIVLVEPEIPENTGNIARTCAATGAVLHLIRPLGFDISEKAVKRAGLDYWHLVDIRTYDGLSDFFEKTGAKDIWLLSSKAAQIYSEATFSDGCWLLFGKETRGLPEELLRQYPERCLRVPMRAEARSLNLGNTVALVTYEALRQQGFPQLMTQGKMLCW